MKRVLHVEPRQEVANGAAVILSEQDFEVSTAKNGAAAIRQLGAGDFDLILLSLPTPVKPPDRVIEWVAANRPQLTSRILVVSEKELSPGADALLESLEIPALIEPFTTGELVQWVNAVSVREPSPRPHALAS